MIAVALRSEYLGEIAVVIFVLDDWEDEVWKMM